MSNKIKKESQEYILSYAIAKTILAFTIKFFIQIDNHATNLAK